MTEAACIVMLASLVAAAAAGFAAYAVLQGAALLICAARAGFLLLHLRKGQTLQLAESTLTRGSWKELPRSVATSVAAISKRG
jgi:hypothetical protein